MARRGALVLAVLAVVAVALLLGWTGSAAREAPARTTSAPFAERGQIEFARGVEVVSEPEAALPEGTSAIEGVVKGRYGPIWGVEVLARQGDETVAEAFTDTEGRYRLDVDPGDYALVARPAPETDLEERSKPARADEGFAAREDFSYGTGRDLQGRVVDAKGEGVSRVQVVAVPADAFAKSGMHARADLPLLRDVPKEAATTDMGGTFRICGLDADGSYVLMIRSERWTHREAVSIAPGIGDGIVVVASPQLLLRLGVLDADLGWRVRLFRVTVRGANGEVFRLDGEHGSCRARLPCDPRDGVAIEVAAPGYATVTTSGPRTTVKMRLSRRDNVLLRCMTPAGVGVTDRLVMDVVNPIRPWVQRAPLRAVGAGVYRSTLPPGPWHVSVGRLGDDLGGSVGVDIDVPEHGDLERDIVLPASGRLVLRSPDPWRWPLAMLLVAPVDPEGRALGVTVGGNKVRLGFSALGTQPGRIYEHVLPGRYRVRIMFRHDKRWQTEVEVRAGETTTVEIPDGP